MTEQPQDYEIIWEKPKACKRPGQARVRRETPLSIEGQVEGSGEPQSNYPQQRLRFRFVDQLHDPPRPQSTPVCGLSLLFSKCARRCQLRKSKVPKTDFPGLGRGRVEKGPREQTWQTAKGCANGTSHPHFSPRYD